jgi:putative hydrolase of the HAD superfamily
MTSEAPITIGIDFDDTLWHTTPHFARGRAILEGIFEKVSEQGSASQRVREIEEHRIGTYGYGYASFVLAGVEALLATDDISCDLDAVRPLFDWAHDTSTAPVELLDSVEETIPMLADRYRLIGITRGSIPTQVDLFLRSGLGDHFAEVEILGRKTVGRYESILRRHRIAPDRFVMIGDSFSADIEPALIAGGRAIHIPYDGSWEEKSQHAPLVADDQTAYRWVQLDSFAKVPAAIEGLVG